MVSFERVIQVTFRLWNLPDKTEPMPTKTPVLPVIVIAQFCCTSLWFASNGVMQPLIDAFQLQAGALGYLTSFVQFGFIVGTLVFALLNIADRFSPSRVFLLSAMIGALANLAVIWEHHTLPSLLVLRFLTGFCLAGIYPVGMKIAADHFEKGLGRSLSFLVGALVLGTAFPHLLRGVVSEVPWRFVMAFTSGIALLGGLLMWALVPDGPYRQAGGKMDLSNIPRLFRNRSFRAAAFGYFGHMWELYAFWAFVPVIFQTYAETHPGSSLNVALASFGVIAVGAPGCVWGGYLSEKLGTARMAAIALAISLVCCLLSPLVFGLGPVFLLALLIIWGMAVIADSPLFSTLVAQAVAPTVKGTALTIVNSIGFLVTIFSIQLLNSLQFQMNPAYIYLFLAIGPLLGLAAMRTK